MKWDKIKFSKLYSIPSKNGLTRPKSTRGHGYKMINMGELFANDRIWEIPMELVPMNDAEKSKNSIEKGDLLFARQSLVLEGAGKCCIVMEVPEYTTFESHLIRVRLNQELALPDYYYYYFKSPISPMKSIVQQCAQAGIRGSDLSELEVDYPPPHIQRRIADILSVYDDLIENNQKQIKLLEEAAMRLYKEWFVYLRFPGHESTPIVDGVPEGWERTIIDRVCNTIGGGTPSTKNRRYYEGGNIPWVTPTDITKNNCIVLLDTEKKITELGLKNSSAKLLPPDTILMTSRASVGYFGLCEMEVCTNQGFISCIPNNENYRLYLLYNLMHRTDEIRQKAGGATYLEISKTTFRGLEILFPNEIVALKFQQHIYPILNKIRVLKKMIKNSLQARDKLLPKLMSGEIEV